MLGVVPYGNIGQYCVTWGPLAIARNGDLFLRVRADAHRDQTCK